jgi:Ca2+-binding EF-hand superfamily protein
LLAGAIAATTFAAEPAPAPVQTQPCDRHGDGMDLNKIKERGAKAFVKIDANGDGKITKVEFLAAEPGAGRGMDHGPGPWGMKGMHRGMGHGMGPKGDMTDAERQAFDADLFKRLDTDGNGQLSQAEFAKAHETVHTLMKEHAFARFDSNKDGVLTKDEFPPFPKRMAAMDANGDGKVTPEEMQAAKSKQAPPTSAPAPTPN